MTFGDVIRKKRLSLGFGLKDVAARIIKRDSNPIHIQYLSDLERNKRNPPCEYYLQQFADYLGLDNDYLCYLTGKIPQRFVVESVTQYQVIEAFEVFRLALNSSSALAKDCVTQPNPPEWEDT